MQFKFTQIRQKGRPMEASRICRSLVAASIPLCLCVSFALSHLPAQAGDATFNTAVKMYTDGKYAQALTQFQVVAQKYPSDPLTRYYMGLCYQHTNQVAQATQMYTWVEQNARSPQLKSQARAGLDSMNRYSSSRTHPGSSPPPPAPDAKAADGKPADGKAADPKKVAEAKPDPKAMKVKKVIQFTSSSSNDQRTIQLFGPHWDAAQEKFKGKVDFQIVDADSGGTGAELMKKYGVSSYPTVVYLDKEGKMLGNTPGASGDITSTIEGYK